MQETWVRSLVWEDPLEKGRERLPTPVFWPGEFHRLYSLRDSKESEDTTEWLSLRLFNLKNAAKKQSTQVQAFAFKRKNRLFIRWGRRGAGRTESSLEVMCWLNQLDGCVLFRTGRTDDAGAEKEPRGTEQPGEASLPCCEPAFPKLGTRFVLLFLGWVRWF